MNPNVWYAGFVLAYVLGFFTYDLAYMKGQLVKNIPSNPQAWILPQRSLATKVATEFPKTEPALYAEAKVAPPTMPTLDEMAAPLLKTKELKKSLENRSNEIESIQ